MGGNGRSLGRGDWITIQGTPSRRLELKLKTFNAKPQQLQQLNNLYTSLEDFPVYPRRRMW